MLVERFSQENERLAGEVERMRTGRDVPADEYRGAAPPFPACSGSRCQPS